MVSHALSLAMVVDLNIFDNLCYVIAYILCKNCAHNKINVEHSSKIFRGVYYSMFGIKSTGKSI